jgi:hypothetical protein
VTITDDVTAPSVSVAGGTASSDPTTVAVTASDAGSGLAGSPTCTVDSTPVTVSGTGPWSIEVSGYGPHTVSCSASDNSGNTGSDTQTVTIPDVTDPVVSVSMVTVTNLDPVTATVTATDADSGIASVTCTVDTVPATPTPVGGDTWTLPVSGEGSHLVACDATDNAGNIGAGSASTLIDQTDPTLSISLPAVTNSDPVAGTVSASDAASGIAGSPVCTVDGNPVALTGGPGTWNFEISGAGFRFVQCQAADFAGNASTTSANLLIDTTAPALSLSGPGISATDPGTVTVTASDGDAGLAGAPTCTLDGSPTTVSGTGPWTVSVPGEGAHTVACSVSDLAGNTASASTDQFVDTTAPSISLSGTGTFATGPVTVTVTASDGGSGLVGAPGCTIDGSPAAVSGAGPWTVSVSGTGSHTVACSVTDNAGNTSSTTGNVTITGATDTTPPVVNLVGGTFTNPASIPFTVTETESGLAGAPVCEYNPAGSPKWNPMPVSGSGSNWTVDLSWPTTGNGRMRCTATDNAGNVSVTVTVNVKLV